MSKGKARVDYLGSAGLVQSDTAPGWDFLYKASTVKDSKWNIGDRVVLPDGRVFRYGKCGAALTSMKRGVKNYNLLVTELDAIAGAASIGAKSIEITFADTDGVLNGGVIAEDSLRGGYISIYASAADRPQRGIIGNDARANGDTGTTTVYLDATLNVAVTAGSNCEILANPYSDLRELNDTHTSVMGMPLVDAAVNEYFWIQTWGPCRITPTGAELGASADTRMFVFEAYGGVQSVDASDALDRSEQIAGFVIERTDGAAGSAAPFINLQINP